MASETGTDQETGTKVSSGGEGVTGEDGSVRYHVHLDTQAEGGMLTAGTLDLDERYDMGWSGTVGFSYRVEDGLIGIGNVTGLMFGNRAIPGLAATLYLELYDSDDPGGSGTGLRIWPSMVTSVSPDRTDDFRTATCHVGLVDPVTFLWNRPVWGAYRGESVGRMVGGVLSIAAGGDGKPSLEPMLPGLPAVKIVEDYRDELMELPYSVATGETLREWMRLVTGQLGLRIEMSGTAEGGVRLRLSDRVPGSGSTPLEMALPASEGGGEAPAVDSARLAITGLTVRPVELARATVLDDPTRGGFRVTALGAVGQVCTGVEVSMDEAYRRGRFSQDLSHAESLIMDAGSRHPLWRPGRLVSLNEEFLTVDTWQIARVRHRVTGNVYSNTGKLLAGDRSWHPPQTVRRAPRIVTARVDGGEEFIHNEPVPRDALGRIPVKFIFGPLPSAEELLQLAAADSDGSGYVTLKDFSEDDVESYTDNQAEWEEKVADYQANAAKELEELRDKEEKLDEEEEDLEKRTKELKKADLTPEAREAVRRATEAERKGMKAKRERLETEREALHTKHDEVRKYMAYKEAKELDDLDRDRDGFLSERDAVISDALSEELSDADKRETLEQEWRLKREGELSEVSEEREQLIEEYGALFHPESLAAGETIVLPGLPEEEASMTREELDDLKDDAEVKSQQWPPRLPLTIVQPMAGTLHGFVPSHREGDSCRVAVHHPLWAEIVGFQYRHGQSINAQLREAAAGMVVEHDTGDAWTGVVFRRRE